jgi:acyl-CoA synthetase (NDP forming)
MLGGATAETYASALPLLLEDQQVDAAIVLFVPTVTATAETVAESIDRAAARLRPRSPSLRSC